MKNWLASLVNLLTLIVGIAIGVMLAPHIEKRADATGQTPAPAGMERPLPPSGFTGFVVTVTKVHPQVLSGTIGSSVNLAHYMQSDELVVNGYDVVKLQNAQLALLSRVIPERDVKAAAESARANHLYEILRPDQTDSADPKKSGNDR